MLRTLRRWFSDAETQKLAQEVDQALHRIADMGIKVESLQLRVDRHMNKLQMRDARQRERETGLNDDDRELLARLRAHGGNGQEEDPDFR